ncbi:MAG: hypothetical protein CFH01_01471 [Alphaproteobacteria bacterium MarineAlpha2_Bin1]|nr:MAG: hypothetical protein CFH01_01471 [Alphaproteobacteria bacterium MarineAlpha2_Bin1]|tara:strand:- start:445 stop:1470 length:1026 start_codon:yes stop_codon:yes gene_type:complete
MKVPPNKAEYFLSSIPINIFAILFYGPNKGLVSLRAEKLYSTWLSTGENSNEIIKLDGADILKNNSLLFDHLNSISLISNTVIISISNISDSITKIFRDINFNSYNDIKIIIMNDEMPARSSLRKFFEDNDALASIPCYEDGFSENLAFIKQFLNSKNLSLSINHIQEIASLLSTDRLINYRELSKLITYMKGDIKQVNSDVIGKVLNSNNAFSLENISYAVGSGNKLEVIKNLKAAFRYGTSPVSVIRSCTYHFERILLVKQKYIMNNSINESMKILKPMVFYKREKVFIQQVNGWNENLLFKALSTFLRAETLCKKYSYIANIMCEQTLLSVSSGFNKN